MSTAYLIKPGRSVQHHNANDPSAGFNELQCGYRSKPCFNERAIKLDGTLHKLCEFHRLKANSSQRRLQKRRQMRKLEAALTEKLARESDSEASTTNEDALSIRPIKRARVSDPLSAVVADDSVLLVGVLTTYEFNPSEMAVLEQAPFGSASSLFSETPVVLPAPLGFPDMDVVIADVLRELNGPASVPTQGVSNT